MTESTGRTSEPCDESTPIVETGSASGSWRPPLTDAERRGLVRLAYRFVWNLDDAEDAVQEALHVAEVRSAQLRHRDKWWSWLCKIVVQKCHALGREHKRQKRQLDGYHLDLNRRDGAPGELSAESRAVRDLLPALPPRQRDVLVLRHLQGLGDGAIAEILGIAPATVRVHARAARESLCKLLKRRHPGWFDPDR